MAYRLFQQGTQLCELGEDDLQYKAGTRRGTVVEPDRVFLTCTTQLTPGQYELKDDVGATATISVQGVRADGEGRCLAQGIILSMK